MERMGSPVCHGGGMTLRTAKKTSGFVLAAWLCTLLGWVVITAAQEDDRGTIQPAQARQAPDIDSCPLRRLPHDRSDRAATIAGGPMDSDG
jgi:hypothetical protein